MEIKRRHFGIYQITVLCVLPFFLSGCLRAGAIYTNDILPVSTDFNRTPIGSRRIVLGSEKVKEPITGYDFSAEWKDKTLKELADELDMKAIYYIERRRISWFGVYHNNALIIYGD